MVGEDVSQKLLLMSALGEAIREYRVERGISEEQLADKIGVTQNELSKMETGKSTVNMPALNQIADALTVDIRVLLDRAQQKLDKK